MIKNNQQDSEYFKILPSFYPDAQNLRGFFEKQFKHPLEASGDRFVWDYWFVKNQYNLIRTPSYHYFPEDLYNSFHDFLVSWGQENLGCANISPPWLSYYVDGCFQNWHADVPHGPWAFVYSLTPWTDRIFQGGFTQILKPTTLDFWSNFNSSVALEADHLIERIPAEFNQLTLFDPRLPHSVEEIKGERDPLKARLVIHGWFTDPEPTLKNYDGDDFSQTLNEQIEPLMDQLSELTSLTGILCFKFQFNNRGQLLNFTQLTNTLISITQDKDEVKKAIELSHYYLKTVSLLPNSKGYSMTFPLIFD